MVKKIDKVIMNKLTQDECIKFATSLQPGDNFFVMGSDLVARFIQFGTKEGKDPFDANHVGAYAGNSKGQTIEADSKFVAYHLISDYFNQLKNGKCWIKVFRIKDLSVDDLEKMKIEWKNQIGMKYNNAVNFWFGIWGLVRWIPGADWLAGRLRNLGNKKNEVNCSISKNRIDNAIERARLALGKIATENATPENLYERIKCSKVFELVIDTQQL